MLASADVNSGLDAPPATAAAAPSTTSEWSPATSSPDSSLPAMWDVAPSSGPQPLVIPSGSSHPPAAPMRLSSGQKTAQTTTAAHQDKQDTANNAVAAVSSSAVQFDLADLLSKAATTAQRKQSKKHRSPVSKGDDAGGKLQPATELSASPSTAAQAAKKPMSGQAVDPDQEAAILEKARQLRAERQAEEALIKAISGSSATAAAHGSAGQPAVDQKAAKQMAAQKRAERLALKQAESRAKKAAARQQATADAEVAPVGADQLAPVAEAADKTAAEAAPIDQGAGREAVEDTAAQPTSDADKGSASADTAAAHMAPPADNEADHAPTAAKGPFKDVLSGTVLAANHTALQEAAGQVAGDAVAAQEGVADLADNMAANAATADQTAAEAAAADKEGLEVAASDCTAAEAALGDSLAAEAASADEPAESGQAVAQELAGNAAADEKEADNAVTRAASQNASAAAAGQETTDKAAAQTPAEQATAVEQAQADQAAAGGGAMPEPIAGQQPAIGVAAAGIEVTEPVSAEAVAADRTANKTADDTVAAANEAASKGDVQQSADVARAVQKAAQPAQEAAQPAQEAAQPAQEAAQAVQEAGQAGFSQSDGRVTPTKPKAAPHNLQATSTGFGADKSPPQDGDEPTPDRGSIPTRSAIPSYLTLQLHDIFEKKHDCSFDTLPSIAVLWYRSQTCLMT